MFAGIVDFENASTAELLVEQYRAGRSLGNIPSDSQGCFQADCVNLVQQTRWISDSSYRGNSVLEDPPSGARVVAWARLDNREDLCRSLAQDSRHLIESDAGLILAAYLQWGEEFGKRLFGDFAAAIWDPKNRRCILLRDQVGARPLYYVQQRSRLLFATSLRILADIARPMNLTLNPNREWMARYLVGCSADWTLSPYDNVLKLAPGSFLRFESSNISVRQYFSLGPGTYRPCDSDDDYIAEYLEFLSRSVACRVDSEYPIACESSGGLDSASIIAMASRYSPEAGENLRAYGFVAHELERDCILGVSDFTNVPTTELLSGGAETSTDPLAAYTRFIDHAGMPDEHPDAWRYYPIFERAALAGCRTILSGFGGDQFVTCNGLQGTTEFWRSGRLSTWYRSHRGGGSTRQIAAALRWIKNYYLGGNLSAMAKVLRQSGAEILKRSLLRSDVMQEFEISQLVHHKFQHDSNCNAINEFALEMSWSPSLTARLEHSSLMAASYGLEYRWPMLDIRLLQWFLSIPSEQKIGPGGVGRYLHRRAMRGILPESIIWKDKSMGEPLASALSNTRESLYQGILRQWLGSGMAPVLECLVDEKKLNDFQDLYAKDPVPEGRPGPEIRALLRLNLWLTGGEDR